MHNRQLRTLVLAAAATAALAACGSGDHDRDAGTGTVIGADPVTSTDVPQSARDNVNGLLAYVTQLIGSMTNDTGEPVVIGNAVLPTSDTTEAAP